MKRIGVKKNFLLCFCLLFALALTASAQGTSSVHGPKKKKATTTTVKSTKKKATSVKTTTKNKPTQVSEAEGFDNGHGYVNLDLSVKWATCNVGATSPEQAGDFLQWGETYDKEGSLYNVKMDDNIGGNPTYDAASANWGGSWRLPTKEEAEELVNKCKWIKTTYKGAYGYKVIGPNGKSIFLAMHGYRFGEDFSVEGKGLEADFWTSTPYYEGSAYIIRILKDPWPHYGQKESQLWEHFRHCYYNVRPVMSK